MRVDLQRFHTFVNQTLICQLIIDLWIYCLTIPIHDISVSVPCPHWSILILIPTATCSIAYYIYKPHYKIITLALFFIMSGYGIYQWQTRPVRHTIDHNLSMYTSRTMQAFVYHPQAHKARYNDAWMRYTCIPTLRKIWGRPQADILIYTRKPPRHLRDRLIHHGAWSGKAIALHHVINLIRARNQAILR